MKILQSMNLGKLKRVKIITFKEDHNWKFQAVVITILTLLMVCLVLVYFVIDDKSKSSWISIKEMLPSIVAGLVVFIGSFIMAINGLGIKEHRLAKQIIRYFERSIMDVRIYNNRGEQFNEVEEVLDNFTTQYKVKIELKVLASSGKTVWENCIEKFLLRNIDNRSYKGCNIDLIYYPDSSESNAFVEIIKKSFNDNAITKNHISLRIYTLDYRLDLTGILVNNIYLRYIYKRITKSKPCLIRTCNHSSEIGGLQIDWFMEIFRKYSAIKDPVFNSDIYFESKKSDDNK